MIDWYFYEGQLKSYLVQFCNIFSGLRVETGKGECGDTEFMSVPITIGSRDRVVAAIQTGNTQNKPFSLPIMAVNMSGLSMPANRKGTGVIDSRVFLPAGGLYPSDLRVVKRAMPIPYIMNVELSICTSNTLQTHQILEQLLMLFDPTLQIQTSDAAFDWTKIASVELVGTSNEENYPLASDRRIINWTLQFEIPIFISAPIDVKDELVRKIIIQIGDADKIAINEFGDDGNLVPFAHLLSTQIIEYRDMANVSLPIIEVYLVDDLHKVVLRSPGAWSPEPRKYTVQWYANGSPLVEGEYATGVTSVLLDLNESDTFWTDDTEIFIKVTAENGNLQKSAFSEPILFSDVKQFLSAEAFHQLITITLPNLL